MVSLICGMSETAHIIIGEGRENGMERNQRGRQTMRDFTTGNKLRVAGGEVRGEWALRRACDGH